MLKKPIFHLTILCLVSITHSHSYSQYVAPVRTLEVPAITEIPVMDGIASEAFWSADQDMHRFSEKAGDWDGPNDFTSTFKCAWGYSAFYVFVEIIDEMDNSWITQDRGLSGAPWKFDNIELFFQLDTSTIPTAYSEVTIQLRFNRGDSCWASAYGRVDNWRTDFEWHWENTASGWLLEAAIPWTAVLADGALPEDIMDHIPLIGFDLTCTDYDRTDPGITVHDHYSMNAWDSDGDEDDLDDGTEDNAWNNTSVFGIVTLAHGFGDEITKTPTKHNILVLPNPTSQFIQLRNYLPEEQVYIYNSSGKLVLKVIVFEPDQQIDISALSRGLYLVRSGKTYLGKFIKE